jgi:ComF family protein
MALALGRWLDPVLDLVFPAVCPVCLDRSDEPTQRPFCGPCWRALPVGLGPGCPVCGEPFPGLGGALPCDACRRTPPPYAFARAVAEYRDGMREAIHALKFGNRPLLATPLGRLLAEAGARALPVPPADWAEGLVPVPLHPARLAERGFNQAELLATPCGARWRVPVLPRALIRARATLPQTDLDPAARRLNVRDAFRVPRPAAIRGRRLLLVDDVHTTGATVAAAAQALREAGAAAVGVLALARVVRH